MFCNKCGSYLPDGSTFCPACGAAQQVNEMPAKKKSSTGLVVLLVVLIMVLVGLSGFAIHLVVDKYGDSGKETTSTSRSSREKGDEDEDEDESEKVEDDSEDVADTTVTVSDETESSIDESTRANADTGFGDPVVLSEGDIAPEFTADLYGGGSFKMSEHDNETVILNFWATWCPPCVNEMPAFEMLKDDGDVTIICINCMEDEKTVETFIEDNGYTFNIGYDTDGAIETYYPTDGIPYTLVIKNGVISHIFVGAYDAETQYQEYRNAIDE